MQRLIYGYGVVDRENIPLRGDNLVSYTTTDLEPIVEELNSTADSVKDTRAPYRIVTLTYPNSDVKAHCHG